MYMWVGKYVGVTCLLGGWSMGSRRDATTSHDRPRSRARRAAAPHGSRARGPTWLVLATALVDRAAAAATSTVRTVDELKRAVADPSVSDITLSGAAPFRFDDPWPVAGMGASALLVDRALTLRAATGRRAVLDAGASVSEMRRVLQVGAAGRVTLVGVEMTGGAR